MTEIGSAGWMLCSHDIYYDLYLHDFESRMMLEKTSENDEEKKDTTTRHSEEH
jgi:hypothetical protein